MINNSVEIKWKIYRFEELTVPLLYEILQLRSKIFVVEQADIYLDADGEDENALHLVGIIEDRIVAYSRIFRKGVIDNNIAKFGRVLVVPELRKVGVGKRLVEKALEVLKEETQVQISAQLYLQKFYEEFGFQVQGEPYLDGTIEHIKMELLK